MTVQARQEAMLAHAMGALVLGALASPQAVEVAVNANGTVWLETYGSAMTCIGQQAPIVTETTIRLIAALAHTEVHAGKPSLDAVLPGGERFKGFLPPRTTAPAYTIRVPQARVLTREDYVPTVCTAAVWEVLATAVAARQNILVVGAMSSGKTTLMQALIALIPPEVRTVTTEDTAELSPALPNVLQLYTSGDADLAAVVKDSFRTAAQRLLVGEIRDGLTAIHTLKLWLAVGGGICTTHADSARDALTRLEYLCAEVSPGHYKPLLGDVVDLIVFMQTVNGQRRVAEVLKVNQWKDGQYDVEDVDVDGAGAPHAGGARGPRRGRDVAGDSGDYERGHAGS